MQPLEDLAAASRMGRGPTVTIIGDLTRWFDSAKRVGEAAREFNSGNVGLTVDELIEGFGKERPEIGDIGLLETLAVTLEAAKQGHSAWDAVRVGTSKRAADGVRPESQSAAPAAAVAVVRRTPSSGRPRRTTTPARSARGARSPSRLSEDDPPLPACPGCGEPLGHGRPNKRYHGNACRQRAFYYRARQEPSVFDQAELVHRAEAARRLIRTDPDIDRLLVLSYVVDPTPGVLAALNAVAA